LTPRLAAVVPSLRLWVSNFRGRSADSSTRPSDSGAGNVEEFLETGAADRASTTPMKGVAKENLPTKRCERCGLPFAWRKKWARSWAEVRYCSDRCRRA
jgi:hypothetical protein